MPHERLRPSFAFTAERIEELRRLVPEAFADGKVNWTALRESLGDWSEDEGENVEHFGLTWPGKRDARRMAALPSHGTLVPVPGGGIDEEAARNFFIEGDNLEVLKLLQKSYSGRVKVIYIDPPYNTGNDLVYEDDFKEPIETYLKRTGQLGDDDKPLSTNTRADGRFHSKWLSMMYPRLRVARGLLAPDGVLFASIDDNECHHLRELLNEVFGEECFVCTIVWKKMDSPSRNDATRVVSAYHDYIHVFARSPEEAAIRKKPKPELAEGYQLQLPDGRLARRRQLRKNGKAARRQDRPTLWYPLVAPDGTKVFPVAPEGWEGRWVLKPETWKERESAGLTEWIKRDYGWVPYVLEVLPVALDVPWPTLWTETEQNRQAKAAFTDLMGSGVEFDNPKPISLLREVLRMSTGPEDLCLDFFAGSGSLAHAVMEQNAEDGYSRNFIAVQLPVAIPGSSFGTIADLARERIRRAAKALGRRKKAKDDNGFRAFRLDRSYFARWSDYAGDNLAKLEDLFARTELPLREGWTQANLLIEVMLLEGFPLDSEILRLDHKRNAFDRVTSDSCQHTLLVCLDSRLHHDTIRALELAASDVLVCLDTALSDEAKLQLADRCLLKTI